MENPRKLLSSEDREALLALLKVRFEKNKHRHQDLEWAEIETRLNAHPEKLWSLNEMEITGGEPDVVGQDPKTGEVHFVDCAPETPKGRRSFCYDTEALESRKENKPQNSAMHSASEMGIELLDEDQYRVIQTLESFDTKTSSWLKTPPEIRKLGGAIFADFRYGRVFVYHNGAESYYGVRGFRGLLKV